jgi:hypothetical protein
MVVRSSFSVQTALTYLRKTTADPLFIRVCMFLWSVPLLCLGTAALVSFRPEGSFGWFLVVLLLLLIGLGVWLAVCSIFRSDQQVDQWSNALADGGELPGVIFCLAVVVVAVPLTVALRALKGGV